MSCRLKCNHLTMQCYNLLHSSRILHLNRPRSSSSGIAHPYNLLNPPQPSSGRNQCSSHRQHKPLYSHRGYADSNCCNALLRSPLPFPWSSTPLPDLPADRGDPCMTDLNSNAPRNNNQLRDTNRLWSQYGICHPRLRSLSIRRVPGRHGTWGFPRRNRIWKYTSRLSPSSHRWQRSDKIYH